MLVKDEISRELQPFCIYITLTVFIIILSIGHVYYHITTTILVGNDECGPCLAGESFKEAL